MNYEGKRLGKYRLLREIGRGGFAQVYLGFHLLLEIPVAVKVLKPALLQTGYAAFLAEARILARLEHPFIIRVRDSDVVEQIPFLVMDYAAGGSFRRHYVPGHLLPLAQLLSIVHDLASALDYAHAFGIVHRDIKPENMLVRRHQVMLADFGIAAMGLASQAMGTPTYMAPEQAQGRVHPASDQYSLGICVYEWLVGHPPFQGTDIFLIQQHSHVHAPSLRELRPDISPEVEKVVFRALAKEPEARFPNVTAFANALQLAFHPPSVSEQTILLEAAPPFSARVASPSLPLFWNLPSRNPFFTGREEILKQMHELLNAHNERNVVALSGLGGCGKTQTTVEYAHRFHKQYDSLVFLHAQTREMLVASLLAFARALQIPEKVEEVISWLEHTSVKWLLILDNVEDLSNIFNILPSCGKILITTHRQILGQVSLLPLGEMFPEDAIPFLLRRAGVQDITPHHLEQAKSIVQKLDGFPLALDQAGAYIEENKCSFEDYLQLYEQRRIALLARRGNQTMNYPDSVVTTWSLSLAKARLVHPGAVDLLSACAFLDPDEISETFMQKLFPDSLAFGGALFVLQAYSLVQYNANRKSLSVHRLIQVVVRGSLTTKERSSLLQRLIQTALQMFPKDANEQSLLQAQALLPHVDGLLQHIEEECLALSDAGQLFNVVGLYAARQAQYAQAERLLHAALGQRMVVLGAEHPDVAESLNDLGWLHYNQGDLTQAESFFRQALLMKQRIDGEREHIAIALNNVASVCRKRGKFFEAEQLFQEALVLDGHAKNINKARTLNNLALLYQEQLRQEEAEACFRHALEIWTRLAEAYGAHPDMARTLNNLAKLCREQRRFTEAESFFLQAQEIQMHVLLPDHPDVAETLREMASLYQLQQRYEEAEFFYVYALEVLEQALGQDHQKTRAVFNDYRAFLELMEKGIPQRFASWADFPFLN